MNKQQQQCHGPGGDDSSSPYCCFHPREAVVGVCARCLKDRLLLLLAAAKDANNNPAALLGRSRRSSSISSIPKVFALGSSFLQRLDSRHYYTHRRPAEEDDDAAAAAAAADGNYSDDTASVASLDDSFISIKFEDNGKATWDSKKQQAMAAATKQMQKPAEVVVPPVRSSTTTVVVVAMAEHARRGGVSVTRWRKQLVGRLLQLARWKRSKSNNKAAVERPNNTKARGGAGWIRSLTLNNRRRRAT